MSSEVNVKYRSTWARDGQGKIWKECIANWQTQMLRPGLAASIAFSSSAQSHDVWDMLICMQSHLRYFEIMSQKQEQKRKPSIRLACNSQIVSIVGGLSQIGVVLHRLATNLLLVGIGPEFEGPSWSPRWPRQQFFRLAEADDSDSC